MMRQRNWVTVGDIADAIEGVAPLFLQEEWDNSGLQVGSRGAIVRGVLFALDISEPVLVEALRGGYNMVVTHHPLLFRPARHLDPLERSAWGLAALALRHGIHIYSSHTPLDRSLLGIRLAEKLGLKEIEPLTADGYGAIGEWEESYPLSEALMHLGALGGWTRAAASVGGPAMVQRVALCPGSGLSFFHEAKAKGADIYITGDCKYHAFEHLAGGPLLLDVGHRESERHAPGLLLSIVREKMPTFALAISERDLPPQEYINL